MTSVISQPFPEHSAASPGSVLGRGSSSPPGRNPRKEKWWEGGQRRSQRRRDVGAKSWRWLTSQVEEVKTGCGARTLFGEETVVRSLDCKEGGDGFERKNEAEVDQHPWHLILWVLSWKQEKAREDVKHVKYTLLLILMAHLMWLLGMHYTFEINSSRNLNIVWKWKALSLKRTQYTSLLLMKTVPQRCYLLVILWSIFDQAGDRDF